MRKRLAFRCGRTAHAKYTNRPFEPKSRTTGSRCAPVLETAMWGREVWGDDDFVTQCGARWARARLAGHELSFSIKAHEDIRYGIPINNNL